MKAKIICIIVLLFFIITSCNKYSKVYVTDGTVKLFCGKKLLEPSYVLNGHTEGVIAGTVYKIEGKTVVLNREGGVAIIDSIK